MKKSPAPNLSVGDFKPESYFFYIGDTVGKAKTLSTRLLVSSS